MLNYLLTGAVFACAAPLAVADCQDEVGYVASFKVKAGSEADFEAAILSKNPSYPPAEADLDAGIGGCLL